MQYGAFAEPDTTALEDFADGVLDELAPQTELEYMEALNIAALCVRRARLPEFEALAIAHATHVDVLPPQAPRSPPTIRESDLIRAGASALSTALFDKLPRYEAHLNRELDHAYARYDRLVSRRSTVDIKS